MLTCETCGRRVYDVDFMDDDGQVLCEDCYEKWLVDEIELTEEE